MRQLKDAWRKQTGALFVKILYYPYVKLLIWNCVGSHSFLSVVAFRNLFRLESLVIYKLRWVICHVRLIFFNHTLSNFVWIVFFGENGISYYDALPFLLLALDGNGKSLFFALFLLPPLPLSSFSLSYYRYIECIWNTPVTCICNALLLVSAWYYAYKMDKYKVVENPIQNLYSARVLGWKINGKGRGQISVVQR